MPCAPRHSRPLSGVPSLACGGALGRGTLSAWPLSASVLAASSSLVAVKATFNSSTEKDGGLTDEFWSPQKSVVKESQPTA